SWPALISASIDWRILSLRLTRAGDDISTPGRFGREGGRRLGGWIPPEILLAPRQIHTEAYCIHRSTVHILRDDSQVQGAFPEPRPVTRQQPPRQGDTDMALDRRQFVAAAAGAALLGSWAGAHAQQPSIETLYEAAKKEGELTWYIVYLPSEDAENVGRAFTARYPGVKVNVVRTTAQVAFQRLNQDLQAGTANCDVFSSTDIAHYLDLKKRKLL